MPTNSPKVEIGQVWAHGSHHRYQVLRFDGHWVVCKNLASGFEDNFGTITDDHMPNGWDDGWYVVMESSGTPAPSQQQRQTSAPTQDDQLTAFFKSVPSGHCACNIPREQCSYHK